MNEKQQSKSISSKLELLRLELKKENYDYYIIPHTDPHESEFLSSHWEQIGWLSGFTGSAGTLIIGLKEAYLWTDSRYFLQASEQLANTSIQLQKEGLQKSILIDDFIKQKSSIGATFAIYALLNHFKYPSSVILADDLINRIWENRPSLPITPIFIYDECYSGEKTAYKIARVRKKMALKGYTTLLLYKLDNIAWLLNIRGKDIPQSPLAICFLILNQESADLYIEKTKLNQKTKQYFKELSITIHPYKDIDSKYLTNSHYRNSLVDELKAIKNETEIEGFRDAMKVDGIVMVRFLIWLQKNLKFSKITELGVAKKLHELRAKNKLNKGDSFTTIAGYESNGAIVHYTATLESNANLHPKGLLLVDSGGQYLNGTTDITRTISLGRMTKQMRKDYTAVLRGTINLARIKFPIGTRGSQLDILARMAIWQEGTNYLHGTGHGVGHYLNVHEGPQSIRVTENAISLKPGMITSNEPGIYRTGSHGIRIENLLLVNKCNKTGYNDFYEFETLTLCPIDTKPIILNKMQPEELEYFNNYHQMVYKKLSPLLVEEEKLWLKEATKPIG